MRETSLGAYQSIRRSGELGERQEAVYCAIFKYPDKTDLELTELLCYRDPNKVRPRRKDLLDFGLIEDVGKRECSVSHRSAHIWRISSARTIKRVKRKKCSVCNGYGYIKEVMNEIHNKRNII